MTLLEIPPYLPSGIPADGLPSGALHAFLNFIPAGGPVRINSYVFLPLGKQCRRLKPFMNRPPTDVLFFKPSSNVNPLFPHNNSLYGWLVKLLVDLEEPIRQFYSLKNLPVPPLPLLFFFLKYMIESQDAVEGPPNPHLLCAYPRPFFSTPFPSQPSQRYQLALSLV